MSSVGGVQIQRQKKDARQSRTQDVQEQTMQLLRANAGAAHRKSIDPVYALSESFAQTFDFVGKQRVQELVGDEYADVRGVSMYSRIRDDKGRFLRRFSEYSFRNGRLAAAILQGRGQLVLHTCIQRSAGMAGYIESETRRTVDKTFDHRYVNQTGGDMVHYAEDAHSALALVIDASKTASQALHTVLSTAKLLEGKEVESLKEIFPFLFDDEERKLAEKLGAQKRSMEDSGQRENAQYRAICTALDKTRGVISKKAQMKQQFLNKLETMLANAKAAEEIFQSEAFQREMAEVLMAETQTEGAQNDDNGADGTAGKQNPTG